MDIPEFRDDRLAPPKSILAPLPPDVILSLLFQLIFIL